MSVRTWVVVAGIVSLGVLTAACARPSDPSSASSRTTEPPQLRISAPGVNALTVSPEQGAPGSAVSLDLACLDNLGAVRSPVLDIGALRGNPEGHQPWHLFGTATVRSDAAPGRYRISATCGATTLAAAFTVVRG
ncbi:MAG: hypothetical protein JO364_05475 [Pseudonocardiales bacterium]|nr:hypothetical protein [Pseudonocardiales bacterium]MBV9029761.1 hypothetical protein [Pseudonocardiales bacterium]